MIIPKKINKNSHIRVISLSRSMSILSKESIDAAIDSLQKFGFKLSFGKNVNEIDEFNSSPIKSRVEDLHEAFSDPTVDAVLTVIGGYNSNQLLDYVDYELIKKYPKILCGFSDITAIANAITAKTSMVTYTGPHFSSWAIKKGFDYSVEYFTKCCMTDEPYDFKPSETWSDDAWYLDQENREFLTNEGYWVINPGEAIGRTVGSHARCLAALQGTQYWPSLKDSILLIEEDEEINPERFDRILQSFIHQPDFNGVKGILIGRFQKKTKMTKDLLEKIIQSKKELSGIPIMANLNFGHTMPLGTLPIGGTISIIAPTVDKIQIKVIEH